jgi:hypothetical protein
MAESRRMTRRNALKLAASAAALPLVHIRTVGAAGKLSVCFWDHWVPGGNDSFCSRLAGCRHNDPQWLGGG